MYKIRSFVNAGKGGLIHKKNLPELIQLISLYDFY